MFPCADETCRHCYKSHEGWTVCNHEQPIIVRLPDLCPGLLQCATYKLRTGSIEDLYPGRDKDGLYPGQIRLPCETEEIVEECET